MTNQDMADQPVDPDMNRPLRTVPDMLERITLTIGPALRRQLWVMMLDAECRQLPVLVPIDELPELPEPAMVDGLMDVFCHLAGGGTGEGPDSIMLVLERPGSDRMTPADTVWVHELEAGARRADVKVAGIFIDTWESVRKVRIRRPPGASRSGPALRPTHHRGRTHRGRG